MADTIELHTAKDQLAEVVSRAGRGETFTITRDGVPVAQIVGVAEPPPDPERVRQAVERIKEFRKRRPVVSREEIREMIEEGRA